MYDVLASNVVARRARSIECYDGVVRNRFGESEGNVSTTRVYSVRESLPTIWWMEGKRVRSLWGR